MTVDRHHRARLRGDSTTDRAKAEAVARELAAIGGIRSEPCKRTLLATRAAIQDGWKSVAEMLVLHGDRQLAAQAARFASGMDRPQTDREWLAQELMASVSARQREERTL